MDELMSEVKLLRHDVQSLRDVHERDKQRSRDRDDRLEARIQAVSDGMRAAGLAWDTRIDKLISETNVAFGRVQSAISQLRSFAHDHNPDGSVGKRAEQPAPARADRRAAARQRKRTRNGPRAAQAPAQGAHTATRPQAGSPAGGSGASQPPSPQGSSEGPA